jgi:hypothetical protein
MSFILKYKKGQGIKHRQFVFAKYKIAFYIWQMCMQIVFYNSSLNKSYSTSKDKKSNTSAKDPKPGSG